MPALQCSKTATKSLGSSSSRSEPESARPCRRRRIRATRAAAWCPWPTAHWRRLRLCRGGHRLLPFLQPVAQPAGDLRLLADEIVLLVAVPAQVVELRLWGTECTSTGRRERRTGAAAVLFRPQRLAVEQPRPVRPRAPARSPLRSAPSTCFGDVYAGQAEHRGHDVDKAYVLVDLAAPGAALGARTISGTCSVF